MKTGPKFFLIFIFFLHCVFIAYAQQRKVDSLLNVIRVHKTEDTNLVWTYTRLAYLYMTMDNYPDAISNYEKGIVLGKKTDHKYALKLLYINLGDSYWHIGKYSPALNSYFGMLKISEQTKDTAMIAAAYHGIGMIYQSEKNDSAALKNLKLALKFYTKKGIKLGMARIYNNIGVMYDFQRKYDESLVNHLKALEIKKELRDSLSIATSFNNIGLIYRNKNDFFTARHYYLETFKILTHAHNSELRSSVSINLGNTYIHIGKRDSARYYLDQSLKLALESDYVLDIANAYSSIAGLDSLEGNYKGAFLNNRLYNIYNDSLINEDNTRKAVETQMKYDFDKANEIRKIEQDKKDAIAETKAREQKIILWLVAAGLMIVLIFAVFIFRSYRQKQKANIELEAKNTLIEKQKQEVEYQKELVTEKQKEIIDSIYYAKRIQKAHLPTDKYVAKSLERLKKS